MERIHVVYSYTGDMAPTEYLDLSEAESAADAIGRDAYVITRVYGDGGYFMDAYVSYEVAA